MSILDVIVVTFLCKEGSLTNGNELLSVRLRSGKFLDDPRAVRDGAEWCKSAGTTLGTFPE
jgi:hypothetical protein